MATKKNPNVSKSESRLKSPSRADQEIRDLFLARKRDAYNYFITCLKPRYDRAYKLYMAYGGDRRKEIEPWMSNVTVPYVNATVETLVPRILDSRPDLGLVGRNEKSKTRAAAAVGALEWNWERNMTDDVMEEWVRASLIYGIAWLYSWWEASPFGKKYDYVGTEAIDNYNFWYDWRTVKHERKLFKMRRRVESSVDVMERLKRAGIDPADILFAINNPYERDLTDFGRIRYEIRAVHDKLTRFDANRGFSFAGATADGDILSKNTFCETFDFWYPLENKRGTALNGHVLEYGDIPYNELKDPFFDLAYLRPPFEYEGWGLPLLLESPQLTLNTIKNLRIDANIMSINKMYVVSPNAGIKREQLVTRPFGIIWSPNPDAVKELSFSQAPESAYREEELLKQDMRFASGVDDASMGVGGDSGSATESRHLRESTLERVRLFINHMGSSLTRMQKGWMSLLGQYLSAEVMVRVTDERGIKTDQIVTRDDIIGEYDYKSTVNPSSMGKDEVERKQRMEAFQVLAPYAQGGLLDMDKLVAFMFQPWKYPLDKLRPDAQEQPVEVGMDGQPVSAMPQSAQDVMSMQNVEAGPFGKAGFDALSAMVPGDRGEFSGFEGAALPTDLANNPGQMPPVPPDSTKTPQSANPMGVNMGGKVNFSSPSSRGTSDPMAALMNQACNTQMKR
jgi:hypothetical protein